MAELCYKTKSLWLKKGCKGSLQIYMAEYG